MQLTVRKQIRKLTIHSMFIALIAIMGFVPFLGFLPIGAGVFWTKWLYQVSEVQIISGLENLK